VTISGEFIAFLGLALVAIAGGVLMLNLTKVVHMVVALVFTFVSIAGLYVMLSAEFVAAVQILIYSGAITIIMLFGIMLTRHDDESESRASTARKVLVFLGVASFAVAVYFGIYDLQSLGEQAANLHKNNTEQIGRALYSKYMIPFELTSVLLLVALIGAIILAKKDDQEEAKKE
jgi:NADH-quinone oxidoreductase subunit J